MSSIASRPTANRLSTSLAVPLSQNTAPIHEFACIYTHDIQRKRQKRWQDGFLRLHTFNKRVMVYDVPRSYIGETFLKDQRLLEDGDELTLDRGILVQVCEAKGVVEQGRTELLEKIRPQQQQRTPSKHGSGPRPSPSRPVTLQPTSPAPMAALSSDSYAPLAQLRPKPLNAILGTPRGAHGRAVLPKVSPYQEKHPQQEDPRRPAKRQKTDAHSKNQHDLSWMPAREADQGKRPFVNTSAPKVIRKEELVSRRKAVHVTHIANEQDLVVIDGSDDEIGPIRREESSVHKLAEKPRSKTSARVPLEKNTREVAPETTAPKRTEAPSYRDLLKEQLSKRQRPTGKLQSAVTKRKSLMYHNVLDKRSVASRDPSKPLARDVVRVDNAGTRKAIQRDVEKSPGHATRTNMSEELIASEVEVDQEDLLHYGRASSDSEDEVFECWEGLGRSRRPAHSEHAAVGSLASTFGGPVDPFERSHLSPSKDSDSTKALLPSPSITTKALQALDADLLVRAGRHSKKDEGESAPTGNGPSAQLKTATRPVSNNTHIEIVPSNQSEIPTSAKQTTQRFPPIVPRAVPPARQMPVHPVRPPEVIGDVPNQEPLNPNTALRRRELPLKKSLTVPIGTPRQPLSKTLQRSNSGDWLADGAAQEAEAREAAVKADVGPWSRETWDLFGFMGGESWTMDTGKQGSKVGLGTDDPPELRERQAELIRQAKKACRGMGKSTKAKAVMDEYDYVESTYS